VSDRRRAGSGSPFEAQIGFSRAVRSGAFIAVSGTAPLGPDGKTVAPGDLYAQTRRCLEIVVDALAQLDARPEHVVRTRMLLTDVERWREAARAHGELFAAVRPASTIVQVSRFIDPEWLVEIEADAIVGE
jgi:enamine deaminase RidA (YjgF/YER057c/UK114 family)